MTDVGIALVLIALMFGVVVPEVHRARSASNVIKCASNLKQIGQGLLLYANENNGNYPRTRWNETNPMPTQYTGVAAINPFAADGPAENDVTASMFLLLRTQELTSTVFICPSDHAGIADEFGGLSVQQRSNFLSGIYCSYSLQNCYPGPAAVKGGFKWTNTLKADYAIAADMNPGTADVLSVRLTSNMQQIARANSPNHQYGGQEVLYGDGHVEFQQTPFCGVNQDNIYGVGARNADGTVDPIAYAIVGPPAHKDDSVLLPTAVGRPGPQVVGLSAVVGGIRWYTYLSVPVLVGVVWAFVAGMRSKRKASAKPE